MWTQANRARYDRSELRYPSDLTDAEWAIIAPLIPPGKRGGDKRTVNLREVLNGLLYVLSTGCQWRAIPKDLPPRSTVHGYFDLWATSTPSSGTARPALGSAARASPRVAPRWMMAPKRPSRSWRLAANM